MTNPLLRREDIDFLLFDWLGTERLFERPTFADYDRETAQATLDLAERLALDSFLPHYKEADRIEPRIEDGSVRVLPAVRDAIHDFAEAGMCSLGFSERLGGIGLPFTICAASYAWFAAANIATAAYPMLTAANARLIATFGSPAQIDAFARPQIAGEWLGTMCLSEPQAGSNLGDIHTRAAFDGQDELGHRYRLTGNKMWISGGDQDISENIVHLVLAKIPLADGTLPSGTAGISLFIVPKMLPGGTANDIAVAGLNHKMGYRGTANCLLNFGEGPGAVGWLVGREGDGLRQMFTMMNEARINVGIGGAALAYRAYRQAVTYARDRRQGRDSPDGPQTAIIEHPDVRRMLMTQKVYAEGALSLCLYAARLVDDAEEDPEAAALLALLTPIVKSWPAEFGLAANDLAIQVHGGYGYTRDFDVEQLYRDNRLNPIHEGTTGIQAIDLLKRKILASPDGIAALRSRVNETIVRARLEPETRHYAVELRATWNEIESAVSSLRACSPSAVLEHATPFLRAIGHTVMAWLWLDQSVLANLFLKQASAGNANLLQGKTAACDFFFSSELPHISAWLSTISDNRLSDVSEEVF
ncbi:MAG: acyl-CoA dehydrogenase [Sphingomonas sp.]|nr:acyl-CoA dehydrogenase [Sphingomonas sp.]|tara:strand:- start:780 stop:2540 length:1761 start_codon:yes stop_codon:yes gene_type:complete